MTSFKRYDVDDRRQKIKNAHRVFKKSVGVKRLPENRMAVKTIPFFIH
jgi:hypothetical protein